MTDSIKNSSIRDTAERLARLAEEALADIEKTAADFRSSIEDKLPKPSEPVREAEPPAVGTVEYSAPEFIRMAENALREAGRENKRRTDRPARHSGQTQQRPPRREGRMQQLQRLSDEVAAELPREFYEKLSGGINLTDRTKVHPKSEPDRPLLILGEYRNDRNLGRSIMLYGGSILRTYGHLGEAALKDELRRIIRHEFTHHIESLSGERGLEIRDAQRLAEYKAGNMKR
ncbi:MAG: hypothetical protein IK064_02590 [Clostridia bacterium]|nr:hypothetical protein [Clostridia bacterium]MBR6006495.1 hypothetical protein [Clostridia bacterium]